MGVAGSRQPRADVDELVDASGPSQVRHDADEEGSCGADGIDDARVSEPLPTWWMSRSAGVRRGVTTNE
jgi:hypothetical protein